MQLCKNYVNLKHCIDQKFNAIVIKTAHRRSNFLKTLVSHEIFVNIGLLKILFQNSQNFVNGAMRMEEAFYNISMFHL